MSISDGVSSNQRPQPQHVSTLTDDVQVSDVSGYSPKYMEVDRDQTSCDSACSEPASLVTGPDVQRSNNNMRTMDPQVIQGVSPSSEMHLDENEGIVITGIRATDISLGLRRIPAGFYTAVRQGEREWRTESKPVFVNNDVVEWGGPIPILGDLSATIYFEVYASFEFQPTLGDGEQLRRLTVTVERLLGRSKRELPFFFSPKEGDAVSPCSSLLVTIARRKCVGTGSSASGALELHCSTTEGISHLEDATNQGHTALLRYQIHGERRDLERSLEQFERALHICPPNHAGRAVAQSNKAMAKFILCQVDNSGLSIDICLELYQDALAARPAGHPDRPSTLIKLAMVYMKRCEERQYEVDAAHAKELLDEALDLCAVESYEGRVAACLLHGHKGWRLGFVQGDRPSSTQQDSTQELAGEDPWTLGCQLLVRFEQFGEIADLERTVSLWKAIVRWTSPWGQRYPEGLSNLGIACLDRFKCLGELSDLEDAISRHKDAIDFTPRGHPNKPGRLNNLANSLVTRFKHLGELSDLEDAILRHREAVDLTPRGHPDKPTRLNNLANTLLTRFSCLGELSDLEDAISMHRDAVGLTPQGHPEKPGYLNNLAISLRTRFSCLGELDNLEDAISRHRDAVDLTPQGHPDKPGRLSNLAVSLSTHFSCVGELNSLEDAISMHRDAVDLTPQGHPDKPARLSNLGNSLFTRFQRLGELSILEDAISMHRDAVGLTPQGHPDKPARLNNLAISLRTRFSRLGELRDLEDAISMHRDAVGLTPQGHPDKPARLNNLATSLVIRFSRLGELGDLEDAISGHRDAVDLTPQGHSDKPGRLSNLGNSLFTRFLRFGGLRDLEDAISGYRDAVGLTPQGHPDRPARLNNLANSLLTRFSHLGELRDLEDGISRNRDGVELTPQGHPDKPARLSNLANSLLIRFSRLGELRDLEDAISRHRDAVDLTPQGHPDKSAHLNNLANSLLTRFERLGELSDLEDAISRDRDAVDLTPQDHPDKPARLSNLAISLRTRFLRLGELSDLEDSISRHRDAVDLTPQGHPDKPARLSNLAISLRTCFSRLGELRDLEDAISMHGDAVNLTPQGHPDKPARLSNLGNALFTRFSCHGELSDLEDAISMHRDAVDLTPQGHPDKPGHLNNLANSLFTRFECLGELSDLGDTISRHRDAVDLTPQGHPDKPTHLSNLAISLRIRFSRLGELSDLEDAISMHRDAVGLTPQRHPDEPARLSNLGNAFFTRFSRLGELSDLEDAILRHRDAVNLTPQGHPDKPGCLNNLAISLLTHFERFGNLRDLEDAISKNREAVDLTPPNHSDKPGRLAMLARSFLARFHRTNQLKDLEQVVSLYSHAACATIGPISVRLDASKKWIHSARLLRHHSLLPAYSVAVRLLPQLAWTGLSLTQRYQHLIGTGEVLGQAVCAALESGYPEMAVEWLEHGRSIVWGELLQLRNSFDDLSSAHPDYAHRLRNLSIALENAGVAHEQSLSKPQQIQSPGPGQSAPESLEQVATRHRRLATERDKLVEEIRSLPGFERFALHREFSQLRAAAHSGPVVFLNATDTRCDALIVLANVENVIHVPLPNPTLLNYQNSLDRLVRGDREGQPKPRNPTDPWNSILPPLWKHVVKPVLDALAFSTIPQDRPRIFWCPIGPFTFLPIHAAGVYSPQFEEPGNKVFDFVVSSYTPTLSILGSPPRSDAESSREVHLLVVRQPPSDGLRWLPGVATEIKHIKEIINDREVTLTESSVGTVEEVLGLMKNADWTHFACHGVQDPDDPTQSGLCLANKRRLSISDITTLSRPRGGLAFLSACETAKGDKELSNEAIHISAGMLFAGYGGVIGTMWSISDGVAPDVARDVYKQLFESGSPPDYRDAAYALDDAIRHLRDRNARFTDWIPFIHVGL